MKIGYRSFLQWASHFIQRERFYRGSDGRTWGEDTKAHIEELVNIGVPYNFISDSMNLSIRRDRLDLLPQEQIHQNQLGLIRQWYLGLSEQNTPLRRDRPIILTLDEFLDTYFFNARATPSITSTLFDLHDQGFSFPYQPCGDHMYLLGRSFDESHLHHQDFRLHFFGTQEECRQMMVDFNLTADLEEITSEGTTFDFFPNRKQYASRRAYYGLILFPGIGRIFSLMGTPQGRKFTSGYTIPREIMESGEQDRNEFLAGLLEKTISPHRQLTSISFDRHVDFAQALRTYANQVRELLTRNGIELHRTYYKEIGDIAKIHFSISSTRANLLRVIETIPFKYGARQQFNYLVGNTL